MCNWLSTVLQQRDKKKSFHKKYKDKKDSSVIIPTQVKVERKELLKV